MKQFFLAFLVLLSFSAHLQAATSHPVDVSITITGTFPLSVSNGVLQTAGGQPYFIQGDDSADLIAKLPVCSAGNTFALCAPGGIPNADALPTATMLAFLRDRQTQGVNSLWTFMLCGNYELCNTDGSTFDNVRPFTAALSSGTGCTGSLSTSTLPDCYDLTAPNTASFWPRVDAAVQLAAAFNIQLLLDPDTTMGCNTTNTWFNTILNNGATKVTSYGNFLGARYAGFPNIMWMHGNDYNYLSGNCGSPTYDNLIYTLATTIKSAEITAVGKAHIQSMQIGNGLGTTLDDTGQGAIGAANSWSQFVAFNAVYSYNTVYGETLHGLSQLGTMPLVMGESNYDGEDNNGDQNSSSVTDCTSSALSASPFCPRRSRHQFWWNTMAGGLGGYIHGNHFVWQFLTGQWNTASNIDTLAFAQLGYMAGFLKSIAWTKLVPDQSHTFMTAVGSGLTGAGTACSAAGTGDNVTDTCAMAMKTADGTLGVVYVPNTGTITINLSQLNANPTAQWFNPVLNSYSAICSPSGTSCGTGSHNFSTSGTHADGSSDWVLLITAA